MGKIAKGVNKINFTMLYGDYCYTIIGNFPQKFSPCRKNNSLRKKLKKKKNSSPVSIIIDDTQNFWINYIRSIALGSRPAGWSLRPVPFGEMIGLHEHCGQASIHYEINSLKFQLTHHRFYSAILFETLLFWFVCIYHKKIFDSSNYGIQI